MMPITCAKCEDYIINIDDVIVDQGKWYHLNCYKNLIRKKITVLEDVSAIATLTETQKQKLQDLHKIAAAL